ncbi:MULTISPECIES: MarR family winged helix-turn-helix transcriptional regulator [unclassified Streptomyces]|uniref:MarR family winged helix-turn-helix transcriptional regulator n=1 Tax=unclassified Streptomyces TaxID=2593676 RepID=UPI002E1706D5|nr:MULTISPECIES: MarR family winged helix-turn-helix transcriptional regulator [unclassified Streptomyces]
MTSEPRRDLPQLLGDARRWFEDGLLAALEAQGVAPITHTQMQLFAMLDADGTTVSELARRMGVTRQTVHQAVRTLIDDGLLEQAPDPASARQRLVRRTAEGRRAHERARRALDGLEARLAERIGEEALGGLRAALEAPWGGPFDERPAEAVSRRPRP